MRKTYLSSLTIFILLLTPSLAGHNWYGDTFRKVHLDYHLNPWIADAAEAVSLEQARSQMAMFKRSGVQAIEVFAYDHFGQAFYPSNTVPRHPNLVQDYFGNMRQAAREAGIKVIAYVNVFGSVHLFEKHPDWYVVDQEGKHPAASWLPQDTSLICASSPFVDEVLKPLLTELVERYQPDAIWLDAGSWLVESHCFCRHCKAAYTKQIPQRPTAASEAEDWRQWQEWRIWRRSQIYSYLKRTAGHIHQLNSSILVTDNNVGRFNMGVPVLEEGKLVRWAMPQDMDLDFLSCDPVPFFGNHVEILSRLGRYQSTLGIPFDYMNERFQGWGEWQLRETVDFKMECATILSNGGACFIADQPWPDGTLEPAVYERIRDTYQYIEGIEEPYRKARVVSEIAILASETTNTLATERMLALPRSSTHDLARLRRPVSTDAVHGAYLVLVQEGIQFQIISEANLDDRLSDVRLLIVPEQTVLLDETLETLRSFVQEGGRLLVTGQLGRYHYDSTERESEPIEDLLAVEIERVRRAPLNYYALEESLLSRFRLPDVPMMVRGPMNQIKVSDAEVLARLKEPRSDVWDESGSFRTYTVFGAMPPEKKTSGVAAYLKQIGRGKVVYATGNWFGTYYREGNTSVRKLLAGLASLLLPESERRFVVRKPLRVEANLMQNSSGYLVSLVNSSVQKQSKHFVHAEELEMVRDVLVRLAIPEEVTGVESLPGGDPIEFIRSPGQITLTVPPFEIHAAVQIITREESQP